MRIVETQPSQSRPLLLAFSAATREDAVADGVVERLRGRMRAVTLVETGVVGARIETLLHGDTIGIGIAGRDLCAALRVDAVIAGVARRAACATERCASCCRTAAGRGPAWVAASTRSRSPTHGRGPTRGRAPADGAASADARATGSADA